MHVLGICIAVVCLNILCDKGHPQQSSKARFRTFFVQMGDLCWHDGPALSCAVDEAGTSRDLV